MMVQLTHSYSALKQYENCPKRYYLQRITKQVEDESGEAALYGNMVHELLERRLGSPTNRLPENYTDYEPLCASIEKLRGDNGTLLVEQKMCLNEDLMPTEWQAPDAWLRSILDVLVVRDGTAIVLDWKTGKRRPDPTQLSLFALQVFKHYVDIDRVKSGYIWLKTLEKDMFEYRREEANNLWADLMSRINRIYKSVETDVWPAKPSGLCRYCPARHMCDEAQL